MSRAIRELTLGPIDSKLIEPIQIQARVRNNTICDVNVRANYVQRNIEKLAQGKNVFSAVFLVERICGICSHAHTTPYCQAVERIVNQNPSEQAKYIRVIVAELERIQSHLLNLFEIVHLVGKNHLPLKILKSREAILDLLEMLSGNRVHYGVNKIGGVRCDINTKIKQKIVKGLKRQKLQIKEYLGLIEGADMRHRMENIGFLPKEKAKDVAVGPTARASGVDFDLRRDAPYAAYDKVGVDVKLRTEGDVMSRMSLRLEELLESIEITKRALDRLPAHKDICGVAEIRWGHATSPVEAPRGENRYSIEIDERGRLQKLSIRTPTYLNLRVLRDILVEQNTKDLEIILLSIDPCISCACRRIYI